MRIGRVLAAVAVPFFVLALGIAVVASDGKRPVPAPLIDESKLVDLTYDFDSSTIYWPTEQPFRWEVVRILFLATWWSLLGWLYLNDRVLTPGVNGKGLDRSVDHPLTICPLYWCVLRSRSTKHPLNEAAL